MRRSRPIVRTYYSGPGGGSSVRCCCSPARPWSELRQEPQGLGELEPRGTKLSGSSILGRWCQAKHTRRSLGVTTMIGRAAADVGKITLPILSKTREGSRMRRQKPCQRHRCIASFSAIPRPPHRRPSARIQPEDDDQQTLYWDAEIDMMTWTKLGALNLQP